MMQWLEADVTERRFSAQ